MPEKQSSRGIVAGLIDLFRKPSLECDYVYEILSDIFGLVKYESHVEALVKHQEKMDGDKGAWSEFFSFSAGQEAPQTTAEAIISLVDCVHISEVRNAVERGSRFLVESRNKDGGWADLSGGHSVNDATGCVLAALSEVRRRGIFPVDQRVLEDCADFLLSQQNTDGGWAVTRGESSKMHYTFFALLGLARCKSLVTKKKAVGTAVDNAAKWIELNSTQKNNDGIGLSLDEAPSEVATSLAILSLLETGKGKLVKQEWISFLKRTQTNGGWQERSDSSLVCGSRRTYDFRSIPWIVEALSRTGEPIDSPVIGKALQELKKYEFPSGGFVRDVGMTVPAVWYTCWAIRMAQYMRKDLHDNLKKYVDRLLGSALESKRELQILKTQTRLEKRLMTVFATVSLFFLIFTTFLLYLVTGQTYQKRIWLPFFMVSLAGFDLVVAHYWNSRKRLGRFRPLFLSLTYAAINIFLGLIA